MTPNKTMLDDVLQSGLSVVFCGTAAGKRSAEVQAYYAKGGNSFWETLYRTGLTPTQLKPQEFRLLPNHGIGLTDLCKDQAGNDADLYHEGFDVQGLTAKILQYAPRVLAFNGKYAAAVFYGRETKDIDYGRQREPIGGTAIHVLPSTSGGAKRYWDVSFWRAIPDQLS